MTAKSIANERLDPDVANYRVKNSVSPLMERINQIRATLMSLLQYKMSKLQQQMIPFYSPTNTVMSPFSPLQQLPRPYIAQALIAPPPTQLGALWLAQAGIVVPQPGSSTSPTQPLVFRPIAQFAFAPTVQQLAAAVAAAPIAAQMGANPLPAAVATAIPSPVSATGLALPFAKPPIAGLPLPLPGSPLATSQTSPGVNLGQPLVATLPTTQPGAPLAQPLGAVLPITQPGAVLPITQPGAGLGQPSGVAQPITQPEAALAQPLGATQPITQPGAALGPALPITQPGSTPQDEQIVNVVPVPQPGATPPISQQTLSQGTLSTQPITPTEPAMAPSSQFEERSKPKALLLV